MLDRELVSRIQKTVDAQFDEQIAFTCELVKFPSVRGSEQTAQDFVATSLRKRGYAVDIWAMHVDELKHLPGFSPVTVSYDNALNVVGSHRAKNKQGHSLILNGHIDVVPVGPLNMWTTPPFVPRVENGWLYGRGGGDMKAGIAANIYAIEALKRCGYTPGADVHIQSVIEEE